MDSVKERIVNFIKLLLMILMMIFGFLFVYTLMWFMVGLPQEPWAIFVCLALAVLSELGYVLWCMEG